MSIQEYPSVFQPGSLKSMGLTERETEVLTWVAEGKSNRDVGIILGIKSATVKKHLEHIFRKIGVETRTAAVALVVRATRQIIPAIALTFDYFFYEIPDNLGINLALIIQLLLFE